MIHQMRHSVVVVALGTFPNNGINLGLGKALLISKGNCEHLARTARRPIQGISYTLTTRTSSD